MPFQNIGRVLYGMIHNGDTFAAQKVIDLSTATFMELRLLVLLNGKSGHGRSKFKIKIMYCCFKVLSIQLSRGTPVVKMG